MARRGHGEGTVVKTEFGRWRAQFRAPNGRRISKTYERKGDAAAWLATQRNAALQRTWVDPELQEESVSDLAERWLKRKSGVRSRTLNGYHSIVRTHITPAIGSKKIGRLQTEDIDALQRAMVASGSKPGTIRNAMRTLRSILDLAVQTGAIARNPAKDVAMPAGRRE